MTESSSNFDSDEVNKLVIFSSDGSYIGNIGRQGGGPGEYDKIRDFCIDRENSRIIILDNHYNLLFFDSEGNYLETHKLVAPAGSIGIVSSGVVALFTEIKSSSYPYGDFKLKIYDYIKKEVIVTKFLADEPQIVPTSSHPLSQSSLGLRLAYSTTDTVYSVLANEVRAKYVVNYEGNLKRPDDFFENLPNVERRSKYIVESGYAGPPSNFMETDQHIFFQYSIKGFRYQTVFDKAANKVLHSNTTIANDYFYGSGKGPLTIIAVTESQFILLVEPQYVKMFHEQNKSKNKESEYHPILKPVLEGINGDENSMLLFAKIK
ncbi:6-bladed beta-propeller [Roseivirga echinicomitans]